MAFIYKITNSINNKSYIGKTNRTIQQRFQEHCRASQKEAVNNRPLYKAMKKYKSKLKNESNFFCTAITNKDEKSIPKPVVYVIGRFGKVLKTDTVKSSESIVSRPAPRAGIWQDASL